eukprot:18539_1
MEDLEAKVSAVILSSLLSVASVLIAIVVIYRINQVKEHKTKAAAEQYVARTSQVAVVCNILCCLSVLMYCIWIVFDDQHDLQWFIALRSATTVCWFVAKISLIWLHNGRLYYAFIHSAFQVSEALFISINVIIAVAAPLCLVLGYVGVWNGLFWMISLGFEGFRFIYLVLTCFILIMFNNRLFALQKMVVHNEESEVKTKPNTDRQNLLNVATKNSVLVLFISISACLVVVSWQIFDYVMPNQDHLDLLMPFLMFSADSVVDSVAIYLLLNFASGFYDKMCGKCDHCCKNLCIHTELKMVSAHLASDVAEVTSNGTSKTIDLSTPNTSAVDGSSNKFTETHSVEIH